MRTKRGRVADLAWSDGRHHCQSSTVVYTAETWHGAYRITRTECGSTLTYEIWRDASGGAVPIQHVRLAGGMSLSDARNAATEHHILIGQDPRK